MTRPNPSEMRPSCSCCLPDESPEALRDNLQRYGWSFVQQVGDVSSSWREDIAALFDSTAAVANQDLPDATYRTAESGGGVGIEPKQSWEIALQPPSSTAPSHVYQTLHRYATLMKEVARQVQRALGLPDNVLLTDEADCMDLLRAFSYDVAPTASLGSSPHTDWGSFTVVWQDSVGGLQTYCRACDRWIHVPAANKGSWVVHVGDVTSLVTGWPSPLHRVVSPTKQKRLSLVLFCYPPPSKSLHEIAKQLPPPVVDVDYADYSLLQNQRDPDDPEDPASRFRRIRLVPLRDVFREKWNEVQRA